MADTGDYVEIYRKFFEDFAATVNPNDQLPVKVAGYYLSDNELVGEIVDWTLQYLSQKNCPPSLVAHITRIVIDEMKLLCKGQPSAFRTQDNSYQPLKLMQAVTQKVNEVCFRYRDNGCMSTLPPPRPGLPISTCAIKNTRRCMEDRHVIIEDFHAVFDIEDQNPASYYAVFDGHAGTDAAVYSVSHLHQFLSESSYYPTDPVKALKDAFFRTDRLFIEKSAKEHLRSGTTAVCALLRPKEKKLYVAWLGDSQALLVSEGKAVQVVNPHKPDRQDERQRIEDMGGCVLFWGTWRVDGQLAVSRAIGDPDYKPYVTAEPDVSAVDLTGNEDFLVLACDGLWDFVTEEQAVAAVYDQVRQNPGDLEAVSQRLVQLSKQQGSTDNISVIIIFLTAPSQLASRPLNVSRQWPSLNNGPQYQAVSSMDNESSTNPFANGASEEVSCQKRGLLLDISTDNDANSFKQNGKKTPELFFLGRPSNGKVTEDDDLGPETDVDAVDDVQLPPCNNNPFDTDAEIEQQGLLNFDPIKEPRQETPTPPADEVIGVPGLVPDNVGESGEESEDEWNYYRVERSGKSSETDIQQQATIPVCEKSPEKAASEGTEDTTENMESQLNPNAAEFIPSPTQNRSMDQFLPSETPLDVVNFTPVSPNVEDVSKVPSTVDNVVSFSVEQLPDLPNDQEKKKLSSVEHHHEEIIISGISVEEFISIQKDGKVPEDENDSSDTDVSVDGINSNPVEEGKLPIEVQDLHSETVAELTDSALLVDEHSVSPVPDVTQELCVSPVDVVQGSDDSILAHFIPVTEEFVPLTESSVEEETSINAAGSDLDPFSNKDKVLEYFDLSAEIEAPSHEIHDKTGTIMLPTEIDLSYENNDRKFVDYPNEILSVDESSNEKEAILSPVETQLSADESSEIEATGLTEKGLNRDSSEFLNDSQSSFQVGDKPREPIHISFKLQKDIAPEMESQPELVKLNGDDSLSFDIQDPLLEETFNYNETDDGLKAYSSTDLGENVPTALTEGNSDVVIGDGVTSKMTTPLVSQLVDLVCASPEKKENSMEEYNVSFITDHKDVLTPQDFTSHKCENVVGSDLDVEFKVDDGSKTDIESRNVLSPQTPNEDSKMDVQSVLEVVQKVPEENMTVDTSEVVAVTAAATVAATVATALAADADVTGKENEVLASKKANTDVEIKKEPAISSKKPSAVKTKKLLPEKPKVPLKATATSGRTIPSKSIKSVPTSPTKPALSSLGTKPIKKSPAAASLSRPKSSNPPVAAAAAVTSSSRPKSSVPAVATSNLNRPKANGVASKISPSLSKQKPLSSSPVGPIGNDTSKVTAKRPDSGPGTSTVPRARPTSAPVPAPKTKLSMSKAPATTRPTTTTTSTNGPITKPKIQSSLSHPKTISQPKVASIKDGKESVNKQISSTRITSAKSTSTVTRTIQSTARKVDSKSVGHSVTKTTTTSTLKSTSKTGTKKPAVSTVTSSAMPKGKVSPSETQECIKEVTSPVITSDEVKCDPALLQNAELAE